MATGNTATASVDYRSGRTPSHAFLAYAVMGLGLVFPFSPDFSGVKPVSAQTPISRIIVADQSGTGIMFMDGRNAMDPFYEESLESFLTKFSEGMTDLDPDIRGLLYNRDFLDQYGEF